jgi:hypothetical protein
VQARGMDVKADAATLDAPTASPRDASRSSYPTEAARRTAFSEDFTPELVCSQSPPACTPTHAPCMRIRLGHHAWRMAACQT